MGFSQIVFLLLVSAVCTAIAFGGHGYQQPRGRQERGYSQGGFFGSSNNIGQYRSDSEGGYGGRAGGSMNYESGDSRGRYGSTLYYDDDVYGYKALYPNGEAMYINYRSKDARARRGEEFASPGLRRQAAGGGAGAAEQRGYY